MDKTIDCGFSDFYMTTGQSILVAIIILLNQKIAVTDKYTNGAKIADILPEARRTAF